MKTIKALSLSIATLLLSACSNGDEPELKESLATPDQGDVTVAIQLGGESGLKATEDGSAEENKLVKLEFYVFDANGDKDNKTGYYKATGSDVKRITKLHIGSSGANVKFVVVANAPTDIGAKNTFADLEGVLAAGAYKTPYSPTTVPSSGFEMVGVSVASIGASVENDVAVALDRLVSKFSTLKFTPPTGTNLLLLPDVELEELWGAGTAITNGDMTFTYSAHALTNGIDKSNLMHKAWAGTWNLAAWTAWSAGKTNLTSTFTATGEYASNYSGNAADGWFLANKVIYAYENAPKEITTSVGAGYDPATVYTFIVKGEIKESVNNTTKVRYWRVNIDKAGDYKIDRNNVYYVNVNAIKSAGYATPEEAETENPIVPITGETYIDITVTVNPWNVVLIEDEM